MKKFFLAVFVLALAFSAFAEMKFARIEDVVYRRKFGMNLTLDVLQPEKTNGHGIVFMVSGGFNSSHESINPNFYQPLLNRGYTVFAVVHSAQPKFTITEIELDIHRAVRFIRHNAIKFGVDPTRLGITGASSGGHLTLTMATQGAKGNPTAWDLVDRESSEVQAAACFYPPTDFLNWSKPGDDCVGINTLLPFQSAFGPDSFSPEGRQKLGKEISPLYFVTSNLAPTLVIHGDADALVPIYQARIFEKRCAEIKAPYKLIVKPGANHGWTGMDKDLEIFADWFDEHLRDVKPKSP
ncbi:MAG: alpha/beta hydrolase [Verrucomicrobiota bacterium]